MVREFGRPLVTSLLGLVLLAAPSMGQERPIPPSIRVAPAGAPVDMAGIVSFVTNRAAVAVGNQTESSATAFLNVPTSELRYGRVHFVLKGSRHEKGHLDDVVVLGSRRRELPESALRPVDPKADTVIYLHGYNNGFDEAVRQGILLRHDLAIATPFLIYSWASQGNLISYHVDRLDIKNNVGALSRFLVDITRGRPEGSVHLIVHSMGNDLFLTAIERLEKSGELDRLRLGKVILAAPDVAPDHFARAVPKLLRVARRVVHYYSARDRAIFFSRYANPGRGTRAGARLVEVEGLEAIEVDEVNDAAIRLGHSYFAASLPILDDIRKVLADETATLTAGDRQGRAVKLRRTTSGYEYWSFLPPGR